MGPAFMRCSYWLLLLPLVVGLIVATHTQLVTYRTPNFQVRAACANLIRPKAWSLFQVVFQYCTTEANNVCWEIH